MERNNHAVKDGFLNRVLKQDKRMIAVFVVTYLIIVFFIWISHTVPDPTSFTMGRLSRETIRSEYTFQYLDKFNIEIMVRSISSKKPNFFRFVADHRANYVSNLSNFISLLKTKDSALFNERFRESNFLFSTGVYNYILSNRMLIGEYANRLSYLYDVLVSSYLLIDQIKNEGDFPYYVLIDNLETNQVAKEKTLISPLEKGFVLSLIGRVYTGMESGFKNALAEIFINLVKPNALYDEQTRNNMIQVDLERSKNYKVVNKGEFIIKRGELINIDNAGKILAYIDYKKEDLGVKLWFYFLLALILFVFVIYRLFKFEMDTFGKNYNILIALLTFVFVNGIYCSVYLFNEIAYLPFFLTIPYAIASITLPVLLKNIRSSLILLVSFSFYYLFYPSFELISFLNFIVLAFLTIYTSQILKNRNDFFKVALVLSVYEILFSLIYVYFYRMNLAIGEWGVLLLFDFGNAFICAIVGSGIMPLLENIFNIPTRFRLLELTNPTTSPLLKLMKTEAHGSYNHSILLGDMCEAAAEKLGIDSLLVKAGGYYHDLGKSEIPQYFIENQEAENRHDEIKPSMSASVIKSHVKLGIEIGKKFNLPEEVIDFIREHHGTTTISYFYHQALGLFGDENVNIEDYVYPGPKPKSKGTAMLMLADGVEATVRAYSQNNERFTTKIIEDIIDDIIQKRLENGQFDDCDITLHDLRIIAEEFNKFLTGYYHKRIEYPKSKENQD